MTTTIRIDANFPTEINWEDTLISYKDHLENGGAIIFEEGEGYFSLFHKCVREDLRTQKFQEFALDQTAVIHLTYEHNLPSHFHRISFHKLANVLGEARYGCICSMNKQLLGRKIESLPCKSYSHSSRRDWFYVKNKTF